MTNIEAELEMLKSRIDWAEGRIAFLEKNWINWTQRTKETGTQILVALEAMKKAE